MAKKRTARATFREVVQIPLLDGASEQIIAIESNPTELVAQLEDLIYAGYEVSFVLDGDGGEQVTCRLFGASPDCPNAGYMLYSNAPTWQGALAVSCYKHFLSAKSGTWKSSEGGSGKLYS